MTETEPACKQDHGKMGMSLASTPLTLVLWVYLKTTGLTKPQPTEVQAKMAYLGRKQHYKLEY